MPQPSSPPPKKRQVLSFVSPKVADIIFYELIDGSLPKYKNTPAFGTAHPSTNKYPNHKLVFVAPAEGEEDKWQKWYYAASRSAQDDYNFEVIGDDRIVRTYILPRTDYLDAGYTPPASGDPDPNAVKFPGYEFVEESVKRTQDKLLDSYFVVIQRTYVNVNKSVAESETGTPRGEEGSETELGSAKTANAIGAGIILQRSSRLTEFDLWHNTENRLSLRVGVNQANVRKMVGYTETDESEFAASEPVSAGEPSFSKRLVTTDVSGVDAVWSANRKTRSNDPAQGSEMTTFLGGGVADIDISLVADTSSADSGFNIIESKVTPIGDGDAIKTTKTLSSYPTLIESRYDASLDAMLTITKDVVAAGTVGSVAVGDITEVRPVDKWRSVRIRTQAAGVEKTENLPGVFSFRFPAVLNSISWIGAYAYAGSADRFDWDQDVAMVFDVTEAYTAAVDGRIIRVVTSSPASVIGAYPATVFKPQSHTLGWVTAGWYASTSMVWAKTTARTWQTPLALSGGQSVTPPFGGGGAISVDSSYSGLVPNTTPSTIPLGWITIGITTRRLRMGYYEVLVRQINSPGP